jgi:magnesium-transporting ATPase (P-type)
LDGALSLFLQKSNVGLPHQTTRAELVKMLPFDYEFAMSGNIWKFGKKHEIYVKGAPEKVIARCNISELERNQIDTKLHEFTSNGFRVCPQYNRELQREILGIRPRTSGNV